MRAVLLAMATWSCGPGQADTTFPRECQAPEGRCYDDTVEVCSDAGTWVQVAVKSCLDDAGRP